MNNNNNSKALSHADDSGFVFVQEMLAGDPTAAINFDRLQYHPKYGYIIFEYLLCDEKQKVSPFTSHPKRYWSKNKNKFISLFNAAQALNAKLYLINYAKKGTKHEDEILVIRVEDMNDSGITKEIVTGMTRDEFQKYFRKLNKECLTTPHVRKRGEE